MTRETAKTILGGVIALGALAHLLFVHPTLTRENVLAYGAFLLFAGMMMDPADFAKLAFWRKDGGA